ncbi:hypothetical protein DSO57_1039439 [Entomophthora muscae]|uniref:Uncharacterized protein n=1 Tax=Entomophthora muscae TaxID=34485 RepID=A0ACC2T966_9FUNG|nr:hypothetical protein DSO57_1039439 [Entomophthora muscae]
MQPDILSSLLVDKKVDLNYTGLSVSPEKAKRRGSSAHLPDAKKIRLPTHQRSRLLQNQAPDPGSGRQAHPPSLDRLDKVDNLEQVIWKRPPKPSIPTLTSEITSKSSSRPLPEVFEHDVIGYPDPILQGSRRVQPRRRPHPPQGPVRRPSKIHRLSQRLLPQRSRKLPPSPTTSITRNKIIDFYPTSHKKQRSHSFLV